MDSLTLYDRWLISKALRRAADRSTLTCAEFALQRMAARKHENVEEWATALAELLFPLRGKDYRDV